MSSHRDLLRVNIGTEVDLIDLSGCTSWPLRGQVNPRDVELVDAESRYFKPGVEFESEDGRPITYRTLLRTDGGRYLIVGSIAAPVNRAELHPQIVQHAQVSRRTARRLLIKSHFANDPTDRYELPEDLKDLGTAADPLPDEDPVRPMIPARPSVEVRNPRVHIDFDADGLRLIIGKLGEAIRGLRQAAELAADLVAGYEGDDPDFGWTHTLGNGSDFSRYFSRLFELAPMLDAADREDLRACANLAIMLGPKASALADQAGIAAEELRSALGKVVVITAAIEAQYLGPRGEAGYWPAVDAEQLATLGTCHRRLSRVIAHDLVSAAAETGEDASDPPVLNSGKQSGGNAPEASLSGRRIEAGPLGELVRLEPLPDEEDKLAAAVIAHNNSWRQSKLVLFMKGRWVADFHELDEAIYGEDREESASSDSIKKLVRRTSDTLVHLRSRIKYNIAGEQVSKEVSPS